MLSAMMAGHKPLHSRNIQGICSREETTWRGAPLHGLYFVESTLPDGPKEGAHPMGPIILVPGSWDPRQGEYSDNLICTLLRECGATVVLEVHFRYQYQDGYFEPDAFVDDLVVIYSELEALPTVVGLCFACPFVLEALLMACEKDLSPGVAGVLVIGNGVPGFLNRLGLVTLRSLTNKLMAAGTRHLLYNGHPHTQGNNVRGEAWLKNSRLVAAMSKADPTGPVKPFPVPVETLYFQLDISTRQARALTRRVFGVPESSERIPGHHRALRRRSPADAVIARFYEKTQERVALRGTADAPCSAECSTSPDESGASVE